MTVDVDELLYEKAGREARQGDRRLLSARSQPRGATQKGGSGQKKQKSSQKVSLELDCNWATKGWIKKRNNVERSGVSVCSGV